MDMQKSRAASYRGLKCKDHHEDPVSPLMNLSEHFGDDTEEEIRTALKKQIDEARAKRMIEKGLNKLQSVKFKHINLFGIKLGTKLAAKIEPFKVQMRKCGETVESSGPQVWTTSDQIVR